MPTSVVSTRSAFAVPANTTLALERPAGVEEGDLLIFAFVIMNDASNDATDFRTALTLPAGWSHAGYSATPTNRIIFVFKYVGDLDEEPLSYTFTYLATRVWSGLMMAIRGAARTFEPVTFSLNPPTWVHPDPAAFVSGYYAPSLSEGAVQNDTDTPLVTINAPFPTTNVGLTRVVYVAMQVDLTGAPPLFDDPVPLPNIREKARPGLGTGGDSMAVMLFDVEYEVPVTSASIEIDFNGKEGRDWVIASIAVEPLEEDVASLDNYKSKVMRSLLPSETWETDFDSVMSGVLSIIGTSDNDIGGLFGEDDFLPNGDS